MGGEGKRDQPTDHTHPSPLFRLETVPAVKASLDHSTHTFMADTDTLGRLKQRYEYRLYCREEVAWLIANGLLRNGGG